MLQKERGWLALSSFAFYSLRLCSVLSDLVTVRLFFISSWLTVPFDEDRPTLGWCLLTAIFYMLHAGDGDALRCVHGHDYTRSSLI